MTELMMDIILSYDAITVSTSIVKQTEERKYFAK